MKKFLFGILFLSSSAFAQMDASLSAQYYESIAVHPHMGVSLRPELDYRLSRNDVFSAAIPYLSTVGWQDTTLKLGHTLSKHALVYVEGFLPTSLESQSNSMLYGGSGNLLLQTTGGPVTVKFDNGLMGWNYQYDTKAPPSTDYNAAFALSDKLGFDILIFPRLKIVTTFHLYTFQDFNGQTQNVYRDSFGVTFQATKKISLDWFYAYKNGELNDITSLEGGHYQFHLGATFRL